MKPFGTIMMYYPMVDDETRETLESIMQESEDLYDFVIRLGKKACSQDVPSSLAFLAALWASRTDVKICKRVLEKYKNILAMQPWAFSSLSFVEGKAQQAKMVKALEKAIASEPEDWVLMHLLLRKWMVLSATPEGLEAYDAAEILIEKEPRLECFRSRILHVKAYIMAREGDSRGSLELLYEALEKARKQDDQYFVARLLLDLGNKISLTDFQKAMQLIDEGYSISNYLGIPWLERATLHTMSRISWKLGEYDLALKCQFDASEMKSSFQHEHWHIPLDVSMIYSDLGEGKEALRWALMYEEGEDAGGPGGLSVHACPEFAMAKALLLLGRTDDAFEHIDRLKNIAFKSGQESWLAGYYYTSGLHEIATGETATGMQLIEGALEIYERLDIQTCINRSLIALTKAEILAYNIDESIPDPRDSGSWMIRLEEEATEKRLTGILMQHAMLKAEFRMKLKQIEAARDALEEALETSDQSSVKTLREQILRQLKEIVKVSSS